MWSLWREKGALQTHGFQKYECLEKLKKVASKADAGMT